MEDKQKEGKELNKKKMEKREKQKRAELEGKRKEERVLYNSANRL